jgi:serine/threonine protein kinase
MPRTDSPTAAAQLQLRPEPAVFGPRATSMFRHSFSGPPTEDQVIVSASNKLSMADFNFLAVLGRGHFGKVLLAERRLTKQIAAIKCLKKTEVILRDELDSLLTERTILKLINTHQHPFLVHLYAAFQTASHVCFVMEFASGGDLLSHIQRTIFSEERSVFYAACVTLGLEFLHSQCPTTTPSLLAQFPHDTARPEPLCDRASHGVSAKWCWV